MTCVVGYIKDNKIFMGADSIGSNGYNKTIRKDTKVFKKSDMIFGFTSSFRMGQLIHYKLKIPKHPEGMDTMEYMATLFIDAVIECFETNKFAKEDNKKITGGIFLVGYKNRLFKINNDYQVGENTQPYYAAGSGEETALGAMSALLKYDSDILPGSLLNLALEAAEENMCSVQGPFRIIKLESEDE